MSLSSALVSMLLVLVMFPVYGGIRYAIKKWRKR